MEPRLDGGLSRTSGLCARPLAAILLFVVAQGCSLESEPRRPVARLKATAEASAGKAYVAARTPIRLDPPSVDFGLIQRGTTAETTVRLTNTTDEPIGIIEAKTSCGCMVADVPKEPFGPGKSVQVTIRRSVKGRVGSKSTRTVRFILDGEFEPVSLSVIAQVAEFVTINPSELDRSMTEDQKFVLRATDDRPFRVLGVQPPVIAGELDGRAEVEHEINVSADRMAGLRSLRTVVFKLDHPHVDSLTVPVRNAPAKRTATDQRTPSLLRRQSQATYVATPSRPSLQLLPRRLSFGRVATDEHPTRKVLIKDVSSVEGVQLSVSCDSPLVTVELVGTELTRSGILLELRLLPRSSKSGRLRAKLDVLHGRARGSVELYARID